MDLKVLFLDIDNTLLDFDAAAEQSMKHCFQMFGLRYEPGMFPVFQEENDRIWRKIEKRELSVADLRTIRWQTILKRLGLKADGAAMEDEFKKALHESAVPVDGAMEILPYLYEKYQWPLRAADQPASESGHAEVFCTLLCVRTNGSGKTFQNIF